jgi:hypothetical protein
VARTETRHAAGIGPVIQEDSGQCRRARTHALFCCHSGQRRRELRVRRSLRRRMAILGGASQRTASHRCRSLKHEAANAQRACMLAHSLPMLYGPRP